MIAFGPVPSRRLGRSLGINHIPPKACTYSCVYCQVGRTRRLCSQRRSFMDPGTVVEAVRASLDRARGRGERVDYLTLVPDGEPTLDEHLGRLIQALQPLGTPIAVITNGSLLHRADVRADLANADCVSLKVDTVEEGQWRRLNRPHGRLELRTILQGMERFAAGFRGRLITETMLVADLNDGEAELRSTAAFIARLNVAMSYIAVPTRPPAESWVKPPGAPGVTRAYEVFRALAGHVELLVDYEGDAFSLTGEPRDDLLAIMAVHPMREEAVTRLVARAGVSANLVAEMVRQGELVETIYGGRRYYLRSLVAPGHGLVQSPPGAA